MKEVWLEKEIGADAQSGILTIFKIELIEVVSIKF